MKCDSIAWWMVEREQQQLFLGDDYQYCTVKVC